MPFSVLDGAVLLLVAGRAIMGLRNGAARQLLVLVGGALGELLGCLVVWGMLYTWIYGHVGLGAEASWLGGDQGMAVAVLTALVVMSINTFVLRSPFVAQRFSGKPMRPNSRIMGFMLGLTCAGRQVLFLMLLAGTTSVPGHTWWREAFVVHRLGPVAARLAALLGWEMVHLPGDES
jgi:uncharacterized membrane protein required for colicin V production